MNRPTVGDVHAWLDSIAPFETAEGFDNVGLLIGDKAAPVSKVIFTLDLSEKTVDEAIAFGAELIITHHPIIFSPLRRIHYDTPFGRMLVKLTSAGVSVIAAHTNWDKAPGGVGDTLAKLLALQNVTPLDDYVRLGELATPILASEFAALLTKTLDFAPPLVRRGQAAPQSGRCGRFLRRRLRIGAGSRRGCLRYWRDQAPRNP